MESVFINKNGYGDLTVMSIETYEEFYDQRELYHLLDEGIEDEKNYRPLSQRSLIICKPAA